MMKDDKTLLSVVIPCYNEKKYIETIVERVLQAKIPQMEIIIVDDCSTDGTRDILERKLKDKVAKIVYHEKNQGKGAALRTGFRYATGKLVIIQDADLEYKPSEYKKVMRPILKQGVDVCYGSRFLKRNERGYLANFLANRFLTWLSNCYTGLHLTDMETCYKCFRRDIIKNINIEEERFGFEPEITAKLAAKGIQIKEVPISYKPRTKRDGKSIGLKDGLRTIYCIWKYRKG